MLIGLLIAGFVVVSIISGLIVIVACMASSQSNRLIETERPLSIRPARRPTTTPALHSRR
jgi:hypothetical protein